MFKPILIGASLVLCGAALGEGRPSVHPATLPATDSRTLTETWLAIQASGQAASPVRQSATAAERERAYQRYLKSYEHEIPEYLFDDRGFGQRHD